ncbi:MAG: biotin--[acetyl-CoA-carboxylase] ligase [Beijerinckiaceae bacterium]|nr:biotin--[acetyl-CoA-carboxylase] ligase [Beijerinckiaceae bacterium]
MLADSARAAGYRLIVRDAVGSTMEEARRALRDGDAGRLWIVAREQTAGRGRHGRAWGSPPGNLYASLLLTSPCEPALAPQLGFVAGLALHDAASRLLPPPACGGEGRGGGESPGRYEVAAVEPHPARPPIPNPSPPQAGGREYPSLKLKWPNDLLVGRAKTAGLLLEGESRAGRLDLIIGFGVNIASFPPDTPYPATALSAHAPDISIEAMLAALSDAWVGRFAVWSQPGGFEPIRATWLKRAAFLGETITIRLADGPLGGVFAGLDASGRLELDTADGRRVIDAGDLYFGLPG